MIDFFFQDEKQVKKANGNSHGHNHSHSSGHMNMRGAFLHVLSDALGSIIVVISALVVWLTEWKYRYYMDPALSIALVILILHSVWPLLRESALILLQTVPTHIQVSSSFFFVCVVWKTFVIDRVIIYLLG